jgi:uncharacterized YccA/Bax inhibitor family protein
VDNGLEFIKSSSLIDYLVMTVRMVGATDGITTTLTRPFCQKQEANAIHALSAAVLRASYALT